VLAAIVLQPEHLRETGDEAEPRVVTIPVNEFIAVLREGVGNGGIGMCDGDGGWNEEREERGEHNPADG
jgi:hypothetical protein